LSRMTECIKSISSASLSANHHIAAWDTTEHTGPALRK
jgi:hypothetical protein